MLEVLLILLSLAVGGMSFAHWQSVSRKHHGWKSLVATRLVVNLKSGQSIDGYLVRQEGQIMFLRAAVLIGQTDEPIPMDGQVIIELSEIEFIQSP